MDTCYHFHIGTEYYMVLQRKHDVHAHSSWKENPTVLPCTCWLLQWWVAREHLKVVGCHLWDTHILPLKCSHHCQLAMVHIQLMLLTKSTIIAITLHMSTEIFVKWEVLKGAHILKTSSIQLYALLYKCSWEWTSKPLHCLCSPLLGNALGWWVRNRKLICCGLYKQLPITVNYTILYVTYMLCVVTHLVTV